jgi:multiple sugar transport system ATP-binding protein
VARIVIEHVSKVFGDVVAVDDVTLVIDDGEFMVLVGPSGCGKTTILRIVAGLEDVTQGEVTIGERVVTDLPSKERDIAMVFQNYALYPHMTVAENLGFGLKLRRTPKADTHARVVQVATVLGLDKLLDRKPAALSGGQRQRVAMGRAMVRDPRAFLMDEPLSNLDAKLRVQMRGELARIRDRLRTTTLYVTHDQVEAMTLGHRVAVLRDGVLQQVDTPQALFDHPANLFVAAFIGSPSMNLVEATVGEDVLRFGGLSLPAPRGDGLAPYRGRTAILGIRPCDLREIGGHAAAVGPGSPVIEVVPEVIEELGSEVHMIFTVDAPPVSSEHAQAAAVAEGDDEALVPLAALEGKSQFTAQLEPRASARVGEPFRLQVDPERMHFFDPASGVAIPTHRREGASV